MTYSIEDFDDAYVQAYDGYAKALVLRHKSTRDGNLSLEEAMELLARLLRQYQAKFYVSTQDKRMVWLPFAFIRPNVGAVGRMDDGSYFEVVELIDNPTTGDWDGWLLLNAEVQQDGHFRLEDEKYLVRFTHDAPREDVGSAGESMESLEGAKAVSLPPMRPTITWVVVRREPGSVDRQPFGGRRERQPRIREYLRVNNYSGQLLEVRGQFFDNMVEFSCWTQDHYSAGRLLSWFEHFMHLHTWVLKRRGVSQVWYWERMRDSVITRWRQDLVSRTVRYYVRTEQLEAVWQPEITDIEISAQVTGAIEVSQPQWIAGRWISGQLTSDDYLRLFQDISGQYLFGGVSYIDHGG